MTDKISKTAFSEYFPKKKFLKGLSRPAVFGAGVATGGSVGTGATYAWSEKRRMQSDREQAHAFLMRTDPNYRSKVTGQKNLSALLDDLIQFADPRPRNPLGEFTQQGGGPDPNAMATVYKQPQQQQQQNSEPGLAKGSELALAGGALGGLGAAGGKDAYEHLKKLVLKLSSKK